MHTCILMVYIVFYITLLIEGKFTIITLQQFFIGFRKQMRFSEIFTCSQTLRYKFNLNQN